MLHGADYNPEQWRAYPGIWDEDVRLMQLAGCNVMSVGIFSWAALEPQEGVFDFAWLDEIFEKLHGGGVDIILATPSGARPQWLSQKYPEVLRVNNQGIRAKHGARHNHCFTSPIYREKTALINSELAQRYKDHPALLLWHISNEFSGECHCNLCQEAFRQFLKNKYDNDLDKLNHAWWMGFWSHTYTDWAQINTPSPIGERLVHGLNLDFKRFVTYQTIDFIKNEIAPLRQITPDIPVTTNMMQMFYGLDYFKLAKHLDIASWDSYPRWRACDKTDMDIAMQTAFMHDLMRSLKDGAPFMLMESTPSMTNWQEVAKLKRPGMHKLSSLQAVAHGSDTVQYFQWRKSRGNYEKLHGAVVDHNGHENTRVFRDVAQVGSTLKKLGPITGATTPAKIAIVFDWENRWAIDEAAGPLKHGKDYDATIFNHYRVFWEKGIPVDIVDQDCDISKYELVIAPMTYMVRSGYAQSVEEFTGNGGIYVTTYWSGIVDENDLCHLGGFPGPLRNVLGICSEEIDALYDNERVRIKTVQGKAYEALGLCDIIHAEGAQILAKYDSEFYAGGPALTVNNFGKGKAYYIAFRSGAEFLKDFYADILADAGVKPCLQTDLPQGVSATLREKGGEQFIFLMNFTNAPKKIKLDGYTYTDMDDNSATYRNGNEIELAPVSVQIFRRGAHRASALTFNPQSKEDVT